MVYKKNQFCKVKHSNHQNSKKKNFLRIPTYTGGKDTYQQFIKENIVYPEQAISNQVEGVVYVKYTVNNIGETAAVEVAKGIGYGCDEEALRVIRLLVYEPVRNRGVKMKATMKTRINFNKKVSFQTPDSESMQINYIFADANKSIMPIPNVINGYFYTINL